jgi:hypothetical protein
MKLIFIHGLSQEGKDPVQLQQQWETALHKGMFRAGLKWPAGVHIHFPFYGDRLDELVKEIKAPLVEDVILRGAEQDSSEPSFRGDLLYEMAMNAGISDAEILAYYNGKPQEKGPQNWEWVQSILKALDKTLLGEAAIDAFTRNVYIYLTNKVVRNAIDGLISIHLTEGPCVVVGHSLGSVVGYNVLSKTPPNVRVKRFVTMGSPLGLNAIKRQLNTPLAMPLCAKAWYNAMDERDIVAFHPLDRKNFPIQPPIENKTNVNNHTDNRHGIDGYLDDPDVAHTIYSSLIAPN